MPVDTNLPKNARLFADHRRQWQQCRYVYPVISRRSRGLSLGINLNPDKGCNFGCIYCQVDRTGPVPSGTVDLTVLADELELVAGLAATGALFDDRRFAATPAPLRRLNDIAFSGDGEPTARSEFAPAVGIAAEVRRRHGLDDVKIVLITNAAYVTSPPVAAALEIMDANNGEIWAKLDAGSEPYFRRVNRASISLRQVIDHITAAARVRPVCIQSLWMRIDGQAPPQAEVEAFADRLNQITTAGGRLRQIQIYTVARTPTEPYVTALSAEELQAIGRRVASRTRLTVDTFPA